MRVCFSSENVVRSWITSISDSSSYKKRWYPWALSTSLISCAEKLWGICIVKVIIVRDYSGRLRLQGGSLRFCRPAAYPSDRGTVVYRPRRFRSICVDLQNRPYRMLKMIFLNRLLQSQLSIYAGGAADQIPLGCFAVRL